MIRGWVVQVTPDKYVLEHCKYASSGTGLFEIHKAEYPDLSAEQGDLVILKSCGDYFNGTKLVRAIKSELSTLEKAKCAA